MLNELIKAVALDDEIRVYILESTELVEQTRILHDLLPTSAAALGRTISIASIMGSMLKDEKEKYRIEIRSNGEIQHIIVDAFSNGNVRGLISNPNVVMIRDKDFKLDVGGAIGEGSLSVSKVVEGKSDFVSVVDLQTGEIGDDFVYYFAQSEQIPSALSVGVLVNENFSVSSAGAILMQVLPHAKEATILSLENTVIEMDSISRLLSKHNAKEVLYKYFPDAKILDKVNVNYECQCNREQMLSALNTLNEQELMTLIEEDSGATLECHYCKNQYTFTEIDLRAIIQNRINK